MSTPEPKQLFRFAGLVACAMVTLPVFVDQWFTLPAKLRAAAPAIPESQRQAVLVAVLALECLLAAGFALAFWWNTRRVGVERPGKTGLALLAVQVALSLFISIELMFIVAGELALMLPVRTAIKGLGVLFAAIIALSVAALMVGDFVPAEALAHTPRAIAVPGTILYGFAWTFFAFGAGYLAVTEASARRGLARANSELMATQVLLSDASRMAERLRISRELHDVVGHHLAGLSVNLQLASHLAEGRAAEPVREAHLVARLLLTEVREVVSSLRDPCQTDLRQALEILARGVVEPRVHLSLPDDLDAADPARAHVLFRCAQEALTNAVKHSQARNLWLELKHQDAGWELSVRDDGRGATCVLMGNGLKGMTERLEEFGGQLKLETEAGRGFTLQAKIPAPPVLS